MAGIYMAGIYMAGKVDGVVRGDVTCIVFVFVVMCVGCGWVLCW
jgi:hypothetical protein